METIRRGKMLQDGDFALPDRGIISTFALELSNVGVKSRLLALFCAEVNSAIQRNAGLAVGADTNKIVFSESTTGIIISFSADATDSARYIVRSIRSANCGFLA